MNYELKIKLKIAPYFLLLISYFLFLAAAPAQAEAVDLGVYPPTFHIQTTQKANVKTPFYLQNFSDQSLDLRITLMPFKPSDKKDGTINYVNEIDSSTQELLQNIQVTDDNNPVTEIILSPKQKKDLFLTINIPDNQTQKDYYISLTFTSVPDQASKTTSSQISAGVASNILLSLDSDSKTSGYIKEFSTPSFLNKGPVAFNLITYNTSNHLITPSGNILIKNMFGQTIGKINLLPVNILTNSERTIPDSSNLTNTAIWPETFLVGPYTATLNLALSNNGPVFTKQVLFFAFPLEYSIVLILIILIGIYIGVRVKKARSHSLN